jgi:hypothetical protein
LRRCRTWEDCADPPLSRPGFCGPCSGAGLNRTLFWADSPCMQASGSSNGKSSTSDNRRAGRIKADGIDTSFGEMVDLSATGMKIRCGRTIPAAGNMIECSIEGPDGEFRLMANVVWSRRLGVFVGEAGLEFTDVNMEQRKQLNRLAAFLSRNSGTTRPVHRAA